LACPICNCSYSDQFDFILCESFDNSFLYRDICIHKCNHCGHLFNKLTIEKLKELQLYYEDEYAINNLSVDDNTDRPGSENVFTIERYTQLFSFISPYLNKDSRILDIGCARGGFLNFLIEKGFRNVYGIDPIKNYVDNAIIKNVKLGSVYSIPLDDNSIDIVILDQVLEHLYDLNTAMIEIYRVLDKGGICYIGVPDAERYNDIYYYIMREHLQHFKLNTLKLLAERSRFELIDHNKSESDMIGTLKLPNLSVLLKVRNEIYCWGIGREFMYLYPNTRLKNLNLILVDDTPAKQKLTFKGMKIHNSDILKNASEDSFLIITALVHKEVLRKKAREIGYKGEIIDV